MYAFFINLTFDTNTYFSLQKSSAGVLAIPIQPDFNGDCPKGKIQVYYKQIISRSNDDFNLILCQRGF